MVAQEFIPGDRVQVGGALVPTPAAEGECLRESRRGQRERKDERRNGGAKSLPFFLSSILLRVLCVCVVS